MIKIGDKVTVNYPSLKAHSGVVIGLDSSKGVPAACVRWNPFTTLHPKEKILSNALSPKPNMRIVDMDNEGVEAMDLINQSQYVTGENLDESSWVFLSYTRLAK